MRVRVTVGVILATAIACADTPPEVEWAGAVTDSAGVSIIANPSEGLWAAGEAWTLREELRIGSFGGDADYQFGQIGAITPNSRGEVLVLDRQSRTLSFYSATGDFIRAVGEPGAGPAEFGRGVADVIVGPGDTLLVPDVRNRRIHRLDPEGRHLGSEMLPLERYRALRFKWASSGRAAVQLRPVQVLEDEDARVEDEIRLIEPSGAVGRRLLTVPAGALLGPGVLRYFTPEPMWTVTDDLGVVYAANSEYRLYSYNDSGALERIITKPSQPRPITDRDIRAFFAYLDRAWLAAGVPPSRLPENHARVSFAETFPAFAVFHEGPMGSLWVQPVRAPGELSDDEIERYNFIEDFGASGWDVFRPDGRLLGVVEMPARFQPRLFVGDAIYGVARDELDVQYAVRLRVVGAAR